MDMDYTTYLEQAVDDYENGDDEASQASALIAIALALANLVVAESDPADESAVEDRRKRGGRLRVGRKC